MRDEHGKMVKTDLELPFDRSDTQLYPVSVTWAPPFTMMVDLIGRGDLQVPLSSHVWIILLSQWAVGWERLLAAAAHTVSSRT